MIFFFTSFRISISFQCISPDFESFSVLESGGKAEATLPSVMRPTLRCFTLGTWKEQRIASFGKQQIFMSGLLSEIIRLIRNGDHGTLRHVDESALQSCLQEIYR